VADHLPIVKPTIRLAAPIYRTVLEYRDRVYQIFVEEGVEINTETTRSTIGEVTVKSKQVKNVVVNKAFVPLDAARSTETKHHRIYYNSMVYDYVRKLLEDELLPVIQSHTNAEIRDLQIDPSLFSLPSENRSAINKGKIITRDILFRPSFSE
jgi:hypothetical protein